MKNWASKSKVLDTLTPIQQLKPSGITFFWKKIIFQREGNDIRKYTPLNKEGREKR